MGALGVQAAVFNVTADGVPDRLYANHSAFPAFNSFYATSDWSLEGWVYHEGVSFSGCVT